MFELISCSEAARRLGVHVSTLRAWVREGKIPSYQLGQRYRRVAWDEVLYALAKEPSGEKEVRRR